MKVLLRSPTLSFKRCSAIVLAGLCLLQLSAVLRAPTLAAPAQIDVTLKAGEALTLGQASLAAPQAEHSHLAVRRDGAGAWYAANASSSRQLVLQRDGIDYRSGALALAAGQRFQLGAASFTVDAAHDSLLAFTEPGGRWQYDGVTLRRDGAVQGACPDAPLGARVGAWWNRLAPRPLAVARPLVFGGNLYCGNRLGVAGVDPLSASVATVAGKLQLISGGASSLSVSEAPRLRPASSGASAPEPSSLLAHREEALAGVTALVAGHTRFAVAIDGDTLRLRPAAHVALFSAAARSASEQAMALPPQVRWSWRERRLWELPAGGAWRIALLGTSLLAAWLAWGWQKGRWPFDFASAPHAVAGAAGSALLGIAGLTCLLLQRAGTPPGAGWSMLLGWAALWCVLLAPGRLRLASAAALLLLAVGLLAQLELGLGALESSWLRHFQKTAALLAIGLAAGVHLRLRWRGRRAAITQWRLEWLLVLLAGVALCALAAQVLFGDETGVFDLQPVELAKLALTALSAHCLAIGMGWYGQRTGGGAAYVMPEHRAPLLRWCRLGAPALLFAALLALALLQVDDYSPLILLLVWSASMAFAWALAARRYLAMAAIALLALGAAGAIAWLRLAGAGEVATWSFYADRFLVWLDPASHPHTGQQLLLGARAIAEGGWRGFDGMFGIASLGQAAGEVLRIPQVQDDFAPAFFLNRHGLAAALGLWLLQALFLIGVLQTAAQSHRAAAAARDFRQAWLGRFCCFCLCGGAAFVLGHLLLSWGTNLAIFPIMGQPMSFLSAGGSHLLFFICPLLAFTAISAQTFEEIPSCRSMSNTKC